MNALSFLSPGKCRKAGRAARDSSPPLQEGKRGGGRQWTPALPGHLILLTKLHLRVLATSPCQATFKGSPVLVRHFLGQAPGSPSSASPAATRGGKTSRIWPTAAKRGVRGCRGSSRGSEIPFSPLTGDEPTLPARVVAVGVSAVLQGKEWE